MIGGVSVSARNAVKVRKEVGVNAQAALVVDVNFQTKIHAFACASVSCLAEARAQLLASGDVEIEDEPKLEEDLPMEDDEGEFDPSDEDVSVGEEPGKIGRSFPIHPSAFSEGTGLRSRSSKTVMSAAARFRKAVGRVSGESLKTGRGR